MRAFLCVDHNPNIVYNRGMIIDNIIVGTLVDGLTERDLGVLDHEHTVRFTVEEATNPAGAIFLPQILKAAGLFKSTTEIHNINRQRQKSEKFANDPDQDLWRNIFAPEMTQFKIGRKAFWFIVGDINI